MGKGEKPFLLNRRQFLHTAGVISAGGILAGCTSRISPISTESTASNSDRPLVALSKAENYDRKLIRKQVEELFTNLGGLQDIVDRGGNAVIKVNLVGGLQNTPKDGGPAIEHHVTHPEVVRAVGELLKDAGVKNLYIVEAVWDAGSYLSWGYIKTALSLGAKLIDLNKPDPYPDFGTFPVGQGYYIYENFTLNRILEESGTFVTVGKMKAHCTAGISLSMKNLIGLTPIQYYVDSPRDINRTSLHGSERGKNTRLPRVIVDLNRACPIDLSVLDGISTVEGGEGPWNPVNNQVKPGLLASGKNALATDAVVTSLMGFDPVSEAPTPPFLQSDNYFNLAREIGLGTNLLDEIDIVGDDLEAVRFPFAACSQW